MYKYWKPFASGHLNPVFYWHKLVLCLHSKKIGISLNLCPREEPLGFRTDVRNLNRIRKVSEIVFRFRISVRNLKDSSPGHRFSEMPIFLECKLKFMGLKPDNNKYRPLEYPLVLLERRCNNNSSSNTYCVGSENVKYCMTRLWFVTIPNVEWINIILVRVLVYMPVYQCLRPQKW
jgi:hypothetical protein